MSEYDGSYIYMALEDLQHLPLMHGRGSTIQIRLKDYDKDKEAVKKHLQDLFPAYQISTWEEKQGSLLSAPIAIERGLLNILLFMIIGVAASSILAIFSMIVVEKTHLGIGVLKAARAPQRRRLEDLPRLWPAAWDRRRLCSEPPSA